MKRPLVMMHMSTVEQLRCAGVVAAVTISRSAFPNRLEHDLVLDRFKSLWKKGALAAHDHDMSDNNNNNASSSMLTDDSEHDGMMMGAEQLKQDVDDLLTHALKPMQTKKGGTIIVKAFVIGRTRAYFRAGALEFLEAERLRGLGRWAVAIQRIVRGFVARTAFLLKRNAAIRAIAHMRQFITRRRYLKLRRACIVGQCWIRVKRAIRLVWAMRRAKSVTDIQTRWRMYTARAAFFKCRDAASVIQALARGSMQRPKFRAALTEKKEEAKLENKLLTLQRKLEEAEKKRVAAEKKAEEAKKRPPPPPPAPVPPPREASPRPATPVGETADQARSAPPSAVAAGAAAAAVASVAVVASAEAPPVTPTTPHQLATFPQSPLTPMQLTVQQQHLMDESGKMLEYLRKEVFKLRTQNTQLRTDFDLLKENNQRLMDANASAGASFAALNQHAKQLNKQNQRLQAEVQSYKEQFQKVNLAQVEIKEELKMKQATYIAEVQSRLQYQKTLARIVDTVQDRCRDTRLVEDVLAMSDECESEYLGETRQHGGIGAPGGAFDPQSGDDSVLSRFKNFFG
uniref:Myosin motor domain-containing protein n=1 Tax=Grammatophora oceanica TaxID=210454 RepID=A0A7S1V6W2_9STRA